MHQALRQNVTHDEALHIHFALGKAYEDQQSFEASFRHYAAGNALSDPLSSIPRPSRSPPRSTMRLHIVGGDFRALRRARVVRRRPVFVFGSPVGLDPGRANPRQSSANRRYGRTNGDEHDRCAFAAIGGKLICAAIQALEPSQIRAIGEEYLNCRRPFRHTRKPDFVDKMPGNWINATLIKLALPNARISTRAAIRWPAAFRTLSRITRLA